MVSRSLFRPRTRLTLLTNPKPQIDGGDPATWERIRLVPYEQRFVDEPREANEHLRDKYLKDKFEAEASGILAWLVRGCLEWQRRGLVAPEKIMNATNEYRREEDTLLQFIADEIIKSSPEDSVPGLAIYERYCTWCYRNDKKDKMSRTKFGRRLAKIFVKKEVGSNDVPYFYGLCLSDRSTGG